MIRRFYPKPSVFVLFLALWPMIGCLRLSETNLTHAKETTLKETLYVMRNSIDQYTQDKMKAPQTLEDLVKAGYLRAIPKDPFTDSSTTWQVIYEDVLTPITQTQPGITDIHSGSNQISTQGTRYSSW
jgi:general secretion pathway protein G